MVQTNLSGTLNCLEFARQRTGDMVFLSSSQVYSLAPLRDMNLIEAPTRLEIADRQLVLCLSPRGVTENFPTHLPRSIYGATKLASAMLIQTYVEAYDLKAVINRCGVIAGASQFGKVEQGVFTHWIANHYFGKPLRYTGFEGTGKQVGDLFHPRDLYSLIQAEMGRIEDVSGAVFNVGGGPEISTSLLEYTRVCQEITEREVPLESRPETSPVGYSVYLSDCSLVQNRMQWTPKWSVQDIVGEIHGWLRNEETSLKGILT